MTDKRIETTFYKQTDYFDRRTAMVPHVIMFKTYAHPGMMRGSSLLNVFHVYGSN